MSCLALSDLSDAQIDEMRADLRKRIALFRVVSPLNSLPVTEPSPLDGGVTPGATVTGAYHLETF